MQKSKIVRIFSGLNRKRSWWHENSRGIVATNGRIHLPALTDRGWVKSRKDCKSTGSNHEGNKGSSEENLCVGDMVTDEVINVTNNICSALGIYPEVMQDMVADENTATELLTCNISNAPLGNYVTSLLHENDTDGDDDIEYALGVLTGRNDPKTALNIAYAEYAWPERLQTWKTQSPINDEMKVIGSYPDYWFYIPEFSYDRQQLEVRYIDSSHLLTRTRRKVCNGGIDKLSSKPWLKAASTRKTFLTSVMVEDVIDPMSVPMSVTHFSSEVMRDNGDIHAADLCHDVRNWWKEEDEAGISAIDRIKMRFCLRDRLLRDVDFSKFPPPTKYVNGWPIQLLEALIASIDSKSILYSLTKTGTYNTRAFSSMMGETFFSEVANQEKHGGHGTLTAAEFEHFMGSVIEQMHI
ncbi:hypothetical protein KUTeg_005748 [Tegillarca granosa]|uniref:Uncharacterized protein n=1 Tax=Tegillarca granosa TaxID=220873 RepID=A0ABQ9FHD0_TEGGR|nr:hypothetical protein KUTeg_005748 [Tegillarca granosa]